MDADLIKLVNKLQDTFSNLGTYLYARLIGTFGLYATFVGGELDMPQLAVVRTSSLVSSMWG
jgi:dynamin 1-like protein